MGYPGKTEQNVFLLTDYCPDTLARLGTGFHWGAAG